MKFMSQITVLSLLIRWRAQGRGMEGIPRGVNFSFSL